MKRRIAMKHLAALLAITWCVAAAQAQQWKPDKNVEIIVWSGAGGGADRPARAMQRLFQDKKLLDVASVVTNKPGANGTVGMVYMNQNAGDGHFISMANATLVTNRITGVSPLSYTHVTPLALIAHDYLVIVVKPDSPFKTARDLIQQVAKDPNSASGGINARGGTGHVALGKAVKSMNGDPRKIKLVIFRSGPEAVIAAMGGHVDYAVTVVPSVIAQVKAGQLRILGIASPQRLRGALASAPTLTEQGMDSVSSNWRMVVGPKGMTAPQAQYWDGVLGKMVQTPEWKKDVEDSLQEFVYLNSRDALKYCEQENVDKFKTLTELGLAK
ncbi:MAG: tripartite tricarboxylate transporter substrate binding protein [Burkholderiales bacterium]